MGAKVKEVARRAGRLQWRGRGRNQDKETRRLGDKEMEAKAERETGVQVVALREYRATHRIGVAARVAGVNPKTVSRWLNDNADFKAAYECWKRDIVETGKSEVLATIRP